MKILLCFGTRPEAIKMSPVFHELKANNVDVKVCVTAQHREMLDQVLDFFEIVPDYDLDLMQPNQTLNGLSANILVKMDTVFKDANPDMVLVHGDTTTSSIVALAAFHLGIKVGHIEAGLRTYKKKEPYPEEINRQLTTRISDIHFAPTNLATQNLLNEGVSKCDIITSGNTVIDALLWTIKKIEKKGYINLEIEELKRLLPMNKKMILVTGHRRENFGNGFKNLCNALISISERNDTIIVYPVHLNPNVQDIVYSKLTNRKNIFLISPVSYPVFVWLMQQSFLILTDSGGIQEEAPTIGKPVLITRNISERPEGIEAGFSTMVGTEEEKIINTIIDFLEHFKGYKSIKNPYGNGDAAKKIITYLLNGI